MQGKIIKGIAGFYYVHAGSKVYECKAKGVFRNHGVKPLVGDDVDFEVVDDGKSIGNLTRICPRKSKLIRPAVANVDAVLLVSSIAMPQPVSLMLDKCLISFMMQNVPVAILWNKTDLEADESIIEIYEKAGFETLRVSAISKAGMPKLYEFLQGKTTVLAGASGVGKSSLTNLLCRRADMETGNLSKKIERGRHTTRHSELFAVNRQSYICDTPGFTFVCIDALKKEELKHFYPEFYDCEGECRFHGCMHVREPDCAVKMQIGSTIAKIRYENYVKLYQEIENARRY